MNPLTIIHPIRHISAPFSYTHFPPPLHVHHNPYIVTHTHTLYIRYAHVTQFLQVTQENKVSYEMLKRVCKQASESFLKGNIKEAVFYFEEAQSLLKKDKGVCFSI